MKLDKFEEVLEDVKLGRPVVIIDDKDRENEGDLMVAAEKVNEAAIALMIEHGKGLICISVTEEVTNKLGIPMQVNENRSLFGTNFTVSLDHLSVTGSGVTAYARAKTIQEMISNTAQQSDFVMPGYLFPVCAVPGGVLRRRGQTEGSVDLSRIAGLKPAGVICEIMSPDGEMLSGEKLQSYCSAHQFKVTSVEAILQHRLDNEVSLRRVAESEIGLGEQSLKVVVYVDDVDGQEHLALIKQRESGASLANGSLVRIHSECLTGDVFQSRRCDCGQQFNQALSMIVTAGEGVIIYLQQEGRGIGLGNKLRAYALQEKGLDTVDANIELGFAPDIRNYRAGAQILTDLGLSKVRLITNNPEKLATLEKFGFEVLERVTLAICYDEYNFSYLKTKRDRLKHMLPPHV